MRDPNQTRPVRRTRHSDVVPQGKPESRDVRRIKCGGGYRIVRKTIPGS